MHRFGIVLIFIAIACVVSVTVFFISKLRRSKNANIIHVPLLFFVLGLILIEALIYLPLIDFISDQYIDYKGWTILIIFLYIIGFTSGLALMNWYFASKVTINDSHLTIRTFFYRTYNLAYGDIINTSYRYECVCLHTNKKVFHIFEGCDGLRILLTILRNNNVPVEQLPSKFLTDNASSIILK
ncbi:hypothetical protein RBG61_13810 [Paludicola sp. MB14-C6]|uniref:hypothetical protein n=1 Tax=Paludihabitans sp. MB14-C6 TaxID=3070656 RepID=UPI0027DE6043|nr:hypothetical protein [Paludicola sp. MB14-C6]WMJ23046.1 hypothetical protein RBG61_13810 [Paludicola sp. MB14-C6]